MGKPWYPQDNSWEHLAAAFRLRIEATPSADADLRQEVWRLFGNVGRGLVSMFELTLANYAGTLTATRAFFLCAVAWHGQVCVRNSECDLICPHRYHKIDDGECEPMVCCCGLRTMCQTMDGPAPEKSHPEPRMFT